MGQGKILREELKAVLSGKTFDALLPPLVFVLIDGFFRLEIAVIVSLGLAVIFSVVRVLRKQTWQYALGGLLIIGFASGLAYLTRSAASFFIPAIITSALLLFLALASLLIGKPMAAWVSHLTRGWPLEWFWRGDIKPAYREVTRFWALFFFLRLAVQVILFLQGEAVRLAWANTLLGWPVTILVLILSYLYGIWRLRHLGGPGVQEYIENKTPPWEGQTRGF